VDLDSPRYAAGSAEIQFTKPLLLTGLRTERVQVSYCPDDDAVCLEFRADFVGYEQFWSGEGRRAFIAAVERYKEDFRQRSLAKKRSTKRAYGVVQGFLSWKTLSISEMGTGNPVMEIGYCFKSKSPYFSVVQGKSEYKDKESNARNKTSARVMLYFTIAQAEALAALFDEGHLRGLGGWGNPNTDVDVYE
jgi:hypothetical protein